MPGQPTEEILTVRVINATAAGQTNITGTTVDMAGYDGCRLIVMMGTLSATQVTSAKLQSGAASNGSDAADITGAASAAAADTDSNKMLIVDCWRPRNRYITPIVLRGTANAVIDGAVLELYRAKTKGVTADGTVSQQKVLQSP